MTKTTTEVRYYHWKGTNTAGKKQTGVTLGFQEQDARQKLLKQQINVKKIKARKPSSFAKRKNKMTATDVTKITRQLATMVLSGVPVVQSFKLIAESHHKGEACAILYKITQQVESGSSVSEALRSYPDLFDNFYCDLIATGEQTGHLGELFSRVAEYREKHEEMRKKVVKALIYPAIVSFTAIAVTVLMLVFVIPQFAQIFGSFGAELPLFTQWVIIASDTLIAYGHYAALGSFLFLFLLRHRYRRSEKLRYRTQKGLLTLPVLGEVLLKATLSRFARTLATTFSSGIPLLSGLTSSARTANNLYIEEALNTAQNNTAAGMPLNLALRQTGAFPELMLQMVMIGEESGALDDMLNKMANLYEQEVDDLVDNLGKLLEPFIIIFLGTVIGGLLVAMYMPIFKLMSVMG